MRLVFVDNVRKELSILSRMGREGKGCFSYFSQLMESDFEMIPATLDGTVAQETNSTGAYDGGRSGGLLLGLIVETFVPEYFGMADEGRQLFLSQVWEGEVLGVAMRLNLAIVNAWHNPKFDFTRRH